MSLIRLLPVETPELPTGHMPEKHARRWYSEVEMGKNRTSQVEVFISQKTYIRICAHAGSDLDNELGGWMLGKWRADKTTGREYVVVEAALPALYTQQGSAYLTFTQDSQVAMYSLMEERYPDKELVGWYHTHPKMGIFLSTHDIFLHNNFFPKPWQVALVVEPYTHQGGFFIRDTKGEMDSRHYFGFHELHNGLKKRSVVHWQNLYYTPESQPKERVKP